MATSTAPRKAYTDEQGIERASKQQKEGLEYKVEQKSHAAGHLLRMNDRFGSEGGPQRVDLLLGAVSTATGETNP